MHFEEETCITVRQILRDRFPRTSDRKSRIILFILIQDVIYFRYANATYQERMDALYDDSVAFGAACATLSAILFLLSMLTVDLLNLSASRQISRVRKMFLKSVLRQDMSWYDTNTSTNFASRINE